MSHKDGTSGVKWSLNFLYILNDCNRNAFKVKVAH